MRRRYVDTPDGQIHLREWGTGDRALLLIHWTPFSGRMYDAIAARFADNGWRVLAPDLLGYGQSDARPDAWRLADWARGMVAVLDASGVEQTDVLGGHNGASVAVELALGWRDRVRKLVLDGVPLMTPELRAAFAGLSAASPPRSPDELLARVRGLLAEYIPGYAPEGGQLALFWPALADYLATGFVSSGPVAAGYDIAERLPLLTHPTLLLGAERDTLAANFDAALCLFTPAATHCFAGDHPLHDSYRAVDYAAIVSSFLS